MERIVRVLVIGHVSSFSRQAETQIFNHFSLESGIGHHRFRPKNLANINQKKDQSSPKKKHDTPEGHFHCLQTSAWSTRLGPQFGHLPRLKLPKLARFFDQNNSQVTKMKPIFFFHHFCSPFGRQCWPFKTKKGRDDFPPWPWAELVGLPPAQRWRPGGSWAPSCPTGPDLSGVKKPPSCAKQKKAEN